MSAPYPPAGPHSGNALPPESYPASSETEANLAPMGEPAQAGYAAGPTPPLTPTPPYTTYAPTYSGYTPPPPPPRPRIVPWLLGALALLLIVAGVALGLAFAHGGSGATPVTTGGAQPAATIPVPAAAQDLQQQIINVVKTVQPSVVEVQSQGAQGGAIGSGEIITSDGYIVTNDHVVAGFSQYQVQLSNGKTYPATLKGQDPQDDLAVLKVSAGSLQPISFGDSSKAQVGQFAVALGSPLGLQQSATFGIVSALNRTASEAPNGPAGELTGLIQTSAPINPGNSGGALVNLSGQLIGVPTLGAQDPNSGGNANGIGFAIPSNRVKFVADQLIKSGQLVQSGQGFLGVQGEDVTPQIASAYNLSTQSGVLVVGFANAANGSSPAQSAGLQKGDIIVAVNGQAVAGNNDLAAALQTQQPGAKVQIKYIRGSSTNTVAVTLGERPTNAG